MAYSVLVVDDESLTLRTINRALSEEGFDVFVAIDGEKALEVFREEKPELVLVDPPRAGLGKGVVDSLLKMRPPALVYISCDPATLARDARRLVEGGYRLEQVTPFDMFPQTYHIESVSWWVKK